MTKIILSDEDIQYIYNLLASSLSLKMIIRKTSPFHRINERDMKIFGENLLDLKKNLLHLSRSLNLSIDEVKSSLDLNTILKGVIILSSKSIEKNLLELGIDKQNIIRISSPLSLEDFLMVNPKLPKSQFDNFKAQIQKNWEKINEAIDENQEKEFYFVQINDDLANKLIRIKLVKYFENKNIILNILDESELI
ncbi:MAG: DUF2100 domain-containing protein [Candidatus Lokiarchaeota archaeon]|nr:DUF2100 domain-containing protein [Candidatus Lokiarchaeota archaeon]